MADQTKTPTKKNEKRNRICIDLTKYPHVEKMLERAKRDIPTATTTHFVIKSLERHLAELGYARKRELTAINS